MSQPKSFLALDLASKTGYAHSAGCSGVWTFSGSRAEKLRSLRDVVAATLRTYPAELLAVEAPHHRGGAATLLLVGMAMMAEVVAYEAGIRFEMVHSSTIKKHATGSGKASKGQMIDAASKITAVIDDNHADALLLLEFLCDSKRASITS